MSDREFWVNAGREVMAQSRAIDDAYRRGQRDLAAKVDEAFLALARDLWREAGRAEQRKSHTEAVNLRYAANRISRRLADALPQDADSEPASETRDGGAGL